MPVLDIKAGTHWRQSRIRHSRLCRKTTKSIMSLLPCIHRRRRRKDGRHSGDKNHPLSTKSTKLSMFNFGDNVDGDKSATKSLSPMCTSP